MNKKGCAKFLGNLKALIFAFFMTGVVNRPPANGNNHPYIYIYAEKLAPQVYFESLSVSSKGKPYPLVN